MPVGQTPSVPLGVTLPYTNALEEFAAQPSFPWKWSNRNMKYRLQSTFRKISTSSSSGEHPIGEIQAS
jgi:hypothetical protein